MLRETVDAKENAADRDWQNHRKVIAEMVRAYKGTARPRQLALRRAPVVGYEQPQNFAIPSEEFDYSDAGGNESAQQYGHYQYVGNTLLCPGTAGAKRMKQN